MSADFDIDGYSFELRTLDLTDACRGVKLVGELLGPAMGAADLTSAISAAVGRLPELIELFTPYCKVQAADVAGGRKVDLKPFRAEVFNGHLDRAVLFAANCAAAEFGDFLGAGLERLSTGLAELAQKYPALRAQTPSSGA